MSIVARAWTALFLLLLGFFVWCCCPLWAPPTLLGAILGYILLYEWPAFKLPLLTPLYPMAPFLLLMALSWSCSRCWLLFMILVTSAHDTGAYIVGSRWGRHKILPAVSPGKSWQGFLGGYCFSLAVSFFARWLINVPVAYVWLPFLVLVCNIVALIGDLFESYLKRRVDLKDSGAILPGHGGFLDRFDSLMAVVMLYYLLVLLGLV